MNWIAAKITFDAQDQALATDLIADIFYDLGIKGVVVDDPQMDPTQDWGENAVAPPKRPGVTGYFADTPKAAETCKTLEAALKDLQVRADIVSQATYTRVAEADWAEAWKEYFWPEEITDTIVVKPTWRDYPDDENKIIIEIDPGMAFGTGTHPTTALCIHMIEAHLQAGDTFLDVGTGSGILMIAAAKLGAHDLCGIDSDSMAVTVAEKNLKVNHIDHFRLFTGNLVDAVHGTFDVVVANILAEVILELLSAVTTVLKQKGVFICSGIITAKKEAVMAGLKERGMIVIEVLKKEGWVAIAARRSTH
ncbi:PrmA1: ribosomal protein L11 methyltransferase [Desulfosarcina variabilis str. Montpellier]|uniref:50S ribosomal protein L11 methyltransferase n=1 Tax=Desulfosarcina variabilis TaxID=2300 RepID=UPI003AFAF4E2